MIKCMSELFLYFIGLSKNFLIVGSNAWNGASDGLFTFNVNNAVGYLNVNYGARAKCRGLYNHVLNFD